MRARIVQNFRGMRVVVLHMLDRNRQVLVETLTRLGLSTTAIDPQDSDLGLNSLFDSMDMLFFDADAPDCTHAACACSTASIPIVAVLGLETPSRLQRAFDLQPSALVYKPVRATGIYTAVFFAANEHRRRQDFATQLANLEARHSARRFVIKAIIALAERYSVDDDQAYRILRRESMKQRLTVEEFAKRLLTVEPCMAVSKVLRA